MNERKWTGRPTTVSGSELYILLTEEQWNPAIHVIVHIGEKQDSTLELCDSGASTLFIVRTLADKLNGHSQEIDLSGAGIHGTTDVKWKLFTVGIRGMAKSDTPHDSHDSLYSSEHRHRNKDLQLSGDRTCLSPFVGSRRRNFETQRYKIYNGTKLLPYTLAWRK